MFSTPRQDCCFAHGAHALLFYSPARRPEGERERQRAVDLLDVEARQGDPRLLGLVERAALLLGTEMAALSVIDRSTHRFLATSGFEPVSISRAISFCAHTIISPARLLDVPDLATDRRFAGNPLVIGEPGVRRYTGAAITDHAGHPIGALCAIGTTPDHPTHPDDLAQLAGLASMATKILNG